MNSTSDTLSADLSAIRSALGRVAGARLAGSQLRTLIDSAAPDFNLRAAVGIPTGPGALTQLLKTQFSDIVQPVGKIGGDTLFLIGRTPSDEPIRNDLTRPGSLWAAFASPSLKQQVVFDRQTKSLSVKPLGTSVTEQEVFVEPMSQEDFRKTAEQFIETVPDEHSRQELRETIHHGDLFYQNLVAVLKKNSIALYHRWGLFRVQQIIECFRNRLAAAGLNDDDVEQAVDCLARDQTAAFKERNFAIRSGSAMLTPQPPRQMHIPGPVASDEVSLEDARAIATLVIKHMSLIELRQISVPLGAILDAALLPKT